MNVFEDFQISRERVKAERDTRVSVLMRNLGLTAEQAGILDDIAVNAMDKTMRGMMESASLLPEGVVQRVGSLHMLTVLGHMALGMVPRVAAAHYSAEEQRRNIVVFAVDEDNVTVENMYDSIEEAINDLAGILGLPTDKDTIQ